MPGRPAQKLQPVLDHVRLYGMTTIRVASNLFWRGRKNREEFRAAERRFAHYEQAGHLVRHRLGALDSRVYFVLGTSKMARGKPDKAAAGFDAQSRATRYAILSFCCGGEHLRRKLTKGELEQVMKPSALKLRDPSASAYYFDRLNGRWLLARAVVNLGGDASAYVEKLHRRFEEQSSDEGIADLVRDRAFMMTILCASEQFAALRSSLQANPLPVPQRLAPIEGLANVMNAT